MPLVDPELVLRTWLATAFTGAAHVCTETPANLADVLPVIRVRRFGGAVITLPLDGPNLDVDVFAPDRASAATLMGQVQKSVLFDLPGHSAGGGFVSAATEFSGPKWTPYDNTTLRRFTASYRLAIRSTL